MMTDWQSIESAPENVVVEVKIDDWRGVRNQTKLMRRGNLCFVPDGGMYVYYTPTHWRVAPPASAGGGE